MMTNIKPLSEPDNNKIRLFGNRYLEMFENGYEFTVLEESGNLFHREDGPATYREYPDGVHKKYYVHGNLHREGGPAEIYYDDASFNFATDMTNAEKISEYMKHADRCHYRWFWQGRKCSFKEWLDLADLPEKDWAFLLMKYT